MEMWRQITGNEIFVLDKIRRCTKLQDSEQSERKFISKKMLPFYEDIGSKHFVDSQGAILKFYQYRIL